MLNQVKSSSRHRRHCISIYGDPDKICGK